jgi:hypothetical protein
VENVSAATNEQVALLVSATIGGDTHHEALERREHAGDALPDSVSGA